MSLRLGGAARHRCAPVPRWPGHLSQRPFQARNPPVPDGAEPVAGQCLGPMLGRGRSTCPRSTASSARHRSPSPSSPPSCRYPSSSGAPTNSAACCCATTTRPSMIRLALLHPGLPVSGIAAPRSPARLLVKGHDASRVLVAGARRRGHGTSVTFSSRISTPPPCCSARQPRPDGRGCLAQVPPNHSRGHGERPGIRLGGLALHPGVDGDRRVLPG